MDPSMPVRYYYYCYCYCLLRVALCFSVTSSIVSFRAISAMSLAYPAVLLMYSRDSLTLPGSGTCPFLWQSGRRLRSPEYLSLIPFCRALLFTVWLLQGCARHRRWIYKPLRQPSDSFLQSISLAAIECMLTCL